MTAPPAPRRLPRSAAQRIRWRNGLGWTHEIIRVPDADDWTWRLSIAEIEQSAPFSSFPGIDRVLVLLSGGGLRLDFDDGQVHALPSPYAHHRFEGERALTGTLIDGPTRDFNLMWRREALDAQLDVVALDGTLQLELRAGEVGAYHLLEGHAALDGLALEPGDTALFEAADAATMHAIEGHGQALWIRLMPTSR